MSVFGDYARYYDLLYRDKDYAAEAHYLHQVLQHHQIPGARLLEFGSGTAMHAAHLVQQGYSVWGMERSPTMLAMGRQRASTLPTPQAQALQLIEGDIRNTQIPQTVDAVVSLFHVLSYQTTAQDLQQVFQNARHHLQPGGLFVFDCWYGPGVLTQRPQTRVKRLENEQLRLVRIAEPQLYANQNRVDVNYQIFLQERQTGQIEELQECHPMRYLFTPEIEALCAIAQFRLVGIYAPPTFQAPGYDHWDACFVCQGF